MADLCVVCVQDANNKAKPGILSCLGCKQMFCTRHVVAHRQELANELDLVISERNELQNALEHHKDLVDVSKQINVIDEWMKRTIEQVHQVADDARQKVVSQAEEQKTNIKEQFTELSSQLDIFHENESFYEKDIENMKEKCIHLKAILNQVNINVGVADVLPSLRQAITLQKTGQNEEAVVDKKSVELLSVVENLVKYQQPFKQIKLPHTGSLYIGNDMALLGGNGNYTLIDLETTLMESISIDNISSTIFTWSTDLDGFLFGRTVPTPSNASIFGGSVPTSLNASMLGSTTSTSEIMLITREDQKIKQNRQSFATNGKIKCMACFDDQLLLVCRSTNVDIIEEWSLKRCFAEQRTYGGSTGPINRWRPPLICEMDEIIDAISFNEIRIVLIIRNGKDWGNSRIEFRTWDMHVTGNLMLEDYTNTSLLYLHSMNDGWLFGHKTDHSKPWYYTWIDDSLKVHEQTFLSAQNIETIEIIDCSEDKMSFAICRKDNDTNPLTSVRQTRVLDLYKPDIRNQS